MRKIILAGCENTKRTDFFLKAANELNIPVCFENIFCCEPKKLEAAVVKIDPFVYQNSEICKMEGLLNKYTNLLNRFFQVLLGKLLLEKPDILLLDEPTNYLDVQHIEWLKRYLQKTVETMSARLILSDAVAPGQTIVLDVENGNLTARVEG